MRTTKGEKKLIEGEIEQRIGGDRGITHKGMNTNTNKSKKTNPLSRL